MSDVVEFKSKPVKLYPHAKAIEAKADSIVEMIKDEDEAIHILVVAINRIAKLRGYPTGGFVNGPYG